MANPAVTRTACSDCYFPSEFDSTRDISVTLCKVLLKTLRPCSDRGLTKTMARMEPNLTNRAAPMTSIETRAPPLRRGTTSKLVAHP